VRFSERIAWMFIWSTHWMGWHQTHWSKDDPYWVWCVDCLRWYGK
jgi:hypothetical protein